MVGGARRSPAPQLRERHELRPPSLGRAPWNEHFLKASSPISSRRAETSRSRRPAPRCRNGNPWASTHASAAPYKPAACSRLSEACSQIARRGSAPTDLAWPCIDGSDPGNTGWSRQRIIPHRREYLVDVRHPSAVVFGAMVAGLSVLGSCGGGNTSSPSLGGFAHPNRTPQLTTTIPTPSTQPSLPSTNGEGAVSAPCTSNELTAQQTWQGALGTEIGYIQLTNTATVPCSMSGYAGFVPLGANGGSLPVTVVHREGLNCTPPDGFCTRPGMGPPLEVDLRSGQEAFFGFTYTGNPPTSPNGSPYPCDQGVSTSVIPPGGASGLDVSGTIDPCGPDYQVTISPLYPGTPPGGQQ